MKEIEQELNTPELKVSKPSDTRWLARERCVRASTSSFNTYKFVACLYMLCDILHIVAKLQGSLQAKDLDLLLVLTMVESTLSRLKEIKDHPLSSTWFKDHSLVFSDQDQLGNLDITVTESDKESFVKSVYRPYIQSIIDHIYSRMKSSDIFSAFSVFSPLHIPDKEEDLSESAIALSM